MTALYGRNIFNKQLSYNTTVLYQDSPLLSFNTSLDTANTWLRVLGTIHIDIFPSFYLWSISKPGRNGVPGKDLSKDVDCSGVQHADLTAQQLAYERSTVIMIEDLL